MKKLLIDADILVYKAGYASQKAIYNFQYKDGSTIAYSPDDTLTEIKKDLKRRGVDSSCGEIRRTWCIEPPAYACQKAKLMVQEVLDRLPVDSYQLYLKIGRAHV